MDLSFNQYLTPMEKIRMIQRWVLVHCYLYYELNSSVVSDHVFDANMRQLDTLRISYPKGWKKSSWSYVFVGFDPSTGYGLTSKLKREDLNIIIRDANMIINRKK